MQVAQAACLARGKFILWQIWPGQACTRTVSAAQVTSLPYCSQPLQACAEGTAVRSFSLTGAMLYNTAK